MKVEGHSESRFTALITREGDLFVAQCLDVDIASQGESVEDAIRNIQEALELHFESPTVITR